MVILFLHSRDRNISFRGDYCKEKLDATHSKGRRVDMGSQMWRSSFRYLVSDSDPTAPLSITQVFWCRTKRLHKKVSEYFTLFIKFENRTWRDCRVLSQWRINRICLRSNTLPIRNKVLTIRRKNVEHTTRNSCPTKNAKVRKHAKDIKYNPGNVVIFGSHSSNL